MRRGTSDTLSSKLRSTQTISVRGRSQSHKGSGWSKTQRKKSQHNWKTAQPKLEKHVKTRHRSTEPRQLWTVYQDLQIGLYALAIAASEPLGTAMTSDMCAGQSRRRAHCLSGARECSMISTFVKCFSLRTSSHACRVVCHSTYPLCFGSSLDQGDCFRPIGVSKRQELAHKSTCALVFFVQKLRFLCLASSFRSSVALVQACFLRLLSRRSLVTRPLPVLNWHPAESIVSA